MAVLVDPRHVGATIRRAADSLTLSNRGATIVIAVRAASFTAI
jgi:hypothetical protein